MSFVYDHWLYVLKNHLITWEEAKIRIVLIDTQYYSPSKKHKHLRSIPDEARLAISQPLRNKYVRQDGAVTHFMADDIHIPISSAMHHRIMSGLVCFLDDDTRLLVTYCDNATEMPMVLDSYSNGVYVQWYDEGVMTAIDMRTAREGDYELYAVE